MGAGSYAVNTAFNAKDKVTPVFGSMIRGAGRFENRLSRLTNASRGFGSCITGTMNKINRVMNGFLGLFAIQKLGQYANEATKAAETQLEAETKLTQILKNNAAIRSRGAGEYLKASQDLFNFASDIQNKGVIGDEVLIGGMQVLGGMGFDDSVIKKIIPVIGDIAVQQKGYNVTIQDTEQIAKSLGRALSGNAGALTKMGIILDKNQKKALANMTTTQRTEYLYNLLSKRVGGLNEKLAQTDRGAKIQFMNNLGDRLEDIGKRMIPIEGCFYRVFNRQMPTYMKIINRFFNGIEYGITALKPIFKEFNNLFSYLAAALLPQFVEYTPGIKNLFEGVFVPGCVLAIQTIIKFCEVIGGAFGILQNVFSFVSDNFIPILLTLGTVLGGVVAYNFNIVAWELLGVFVRLQTLTGGIIKNTLALWGNVRALLAQTAAFLTSPVGWITIAIVGLIAVVTLLYKNWDKVTETVSNWWNITKNAVSLFWERCKSVFGAIGSFIKEHFIDILLTCLGPIGLIIRGVMKLGGAIKKLREGKDGGFDLNGGNGTVTVQTAPTVKNYNTQSSGKIDVYTTIDNRTAFPATSSIGILESNNMTIMPAN